MSKKHRVLLIVMALIIAVYSIVINVSRQVNNDADAQWQRKTNAPIMTKWAKEVSPQNVLPEYPRPQMVRDRWLNLNGLWQFTEAHPGETTPFGKDLPGRILVPYPVESALSGVMKMSDQLWYRRTFTLPKEWNGQRVILNFGAVDWTAIVYVNSGQVGVHRGGYDPFSYDITNALKGDGPQELIVGVNDPTDAGDQPRGKQVRNPRGIWYTPTTGIWQTVWLEPVPADHIADLTMIPDLDGNSLRLTVNTPDPEGRLQVRAAALDNGSEVGSVIGENDKEIRIPIKGKKLWTPSDPFLYDLNVELYQDGKQVDAVRSYFGMRKISVGKDKNGITRILLNGEFIMQVGPLDQGFWPDGIYTAPTDNALRSDIEMMKTLGFNMARKHVKVEPDRWYYWADKLGLLVWQDMPSGDNKTPESKKQFETELKQLIATHRNHPSIIMWVVFNEGWGQYDTPRLTAWVKQFDPSRLVNNASGWTDMKTGDVNDIHSYPQPKSPPAESKRAIALGEFGGLGLAIDGHTWKKEHWGYQGMAGAGQLTSRYETLLRSAYQLKERPGLSAAIYTQITDVEVECNGLLTYDREVVKPDPERIAAVNRGDFSKVPPPPVVEIIVPTSEKQGQRWQYTVNKPTGDWFKNEFNPSGWKSGDGGFGTKITPGVIVRTEWKTPDIWLRREFTITKKDFPELQFRVHHDEDAEIYLNGVTACTLSDYTTAYEELSITPEALTTLKVGKNILAVHCRQTGGGQYIDVGLINVKPSALVRK